ncbi:F0F1 ATP synthase subunit epsilon [Lutibacter sp.]|uniref:F0F1 ATP synthase subunit epsilon n=1 Tax=Lutibacter sp. TaxID=1925666 RepID=UPI0027377B9A|nr:F0F1 ATP synthase subunit epsilon [Lutibacter sp.]MDP3312819.1 F0F1 ATP synthase subunit epsilon [Lutibacter sp.]
MILEIVTPEATLLHSEVDLVSVPGINGEFQMLNNHAPIVSLLVKGIVKFKGEKINIKEEVQDLFSIVKGEYSVAIKSGTIEMKNNKIIILAD